MKNNYSDMGEPNFTAFNMAIKALEKENIYDDGEHYVTISKALYDKLNIDVCDDAISRDAVIEWLKEKDFMNMLEIMKMFFFLKEKF